MTVTGLEDVALLYKIRDRQREAAIHGERLLRAALAQFTEAGARKTIPRVRLAITSAGGAVRHANGKMSRAQGLWNAARTNGYTDTLREIVEAELLRTMRRKR